MTTTSQTEDRKKNPWLGLAAYVENDASVFHGRSQEAEELALIIAESPQTTIYGPSGVGKTSLLRAGVFPRIEERNFLPVYIRLNHGNGAPDCKTQALESLEEELAGRKVDVEPLAERVAPQLPETLWEYLHRHEFWSEKNHLLRPVLVFDQFEEVFTLADASRAVRLITELGDLCDNSPPRELDEFLGASGRRLGYSAETQSYRVVICLREDFLARLEELTEQIPSLRRHRFSLQAMSRAQALEAVLKPGGDFVDEPVAQRIIDAVTTSQGRQNPSSAIPMAGQSVEPALLSLFCRELNNRRIASEEARITIELVDQSHTDILRDFYLGAVDSVSTRTASFIEDRLITANGFRSAAALDDATAAGVPDAELRELADRRVLRFEQRQGLRWVELSHDILTPVVRETRDARRNEEKLRSERLQTDALRKESAIQKRRLRWAMGGIAALLLLVAGLAGLIHYQFFKEHVTYYRAMVKRHGFPEGIGKLSPEQAAHRQCSYKFIQHGKRDPRLVFPSGELPFFPPKPVERVVAVNGYFEPTLEHSMETYLWSQSEEDVDNRQQAILSDVMRQKLTGVCQWEFVRGEDGRIVYEKGIDKDGNMVWGLVYSPSPEMEKTVSAHFVGPMGFPQKQRQSGAEYVKITYNAKGFEELHEFRDIHGDPAPGKWGAYGQRFEYDERGLCVSLFSIDAAGNYMLDSAGNSGARSVYDMFGNPVEERNYNEDLELCLVKLGFAITRCEYDEYGNVEEARFYDIEYEPCLFQKLIHGVRTEYDNRGNKIEVTRLGIDGMPAALSDGYATVRYKYNQDGKVNEERYYDADGNPCLQTDGYHGFKAEYDDQGNEIANTWLGIDGEPVALGEGYATVRSEYNQCGKVADQRYYDADGNPCLQTDGYHGFKTEYDDQGNEVAKTWLGIDGEPAAQGEGYATVRSEYNQRGKVTDQRYYDADGNPCLQTDGYHGFKTEYDDQGNEVAKTWLGTDGEPVALDEGYATVRSEYNQRGKVTDQRYYDADGNPCLQTDGYHGFKTEYDDQGNEVAKTWLGTDGEPAALANGYATERYEYNQYGKVTGVRYYDADGKPYLHKDGYHGFKIEYDDPSNVIARTCLGFDGEPVAIVYGYTTERYEYNQYGKVTEVRFYDADGKPCLHKDGHHGFHTEYDDQGNEAAKTWIGGDGNPVVISDGYAMVRYEYDRQGKVTEQRYYGIDGKPCLHKDGFHAVRKKYDQFGNKTEESFFGVDDQPLISNVIVIAQEIVPSSEAEKKGVNEGDILLQYGRWSCEEIEKDPEFHKLIAEFERCKKKRKSVVFYRKGNIYAYEFPPGLIGVRFVDYVLVGDQIVKMREAYESFRQGNASTPFE